MLTPFRKSRRVISRCMPRVRSFFSFSWLIGPAADQALELGVSAWLPEYIRSPKTKRPTTQRVMGRLLNSPPPKSAQEQTNVWGRGWEWLEWAIKGVVNKQPRMIA